jgi:hypothetical protein
MAREDLSRVRLDELTHAAFSGVLRAMEERQLEPKKWPGPILVGIIAWPELGSLQQPEVAAPQVARAKRGT